MKTRELKKNECNVLNYYWCDYISYLLLPVQYSKTLVLLSTFCREWQDVQSSDILFNYFFVSTSRSYYFKLNEEPSSELWYNCSCPKVSLCSLRWLVLVYPRIVIVMKMINVADNWLWLQCINREGSTSRYIMVPVINFHHQLSLAFISSSQHQSLLLSLEMQTISDRNNQ